MEELNGKVAIVTGGASGIGLALATALAAEGARLVIADIEAAALDDAAAGLAATGAEVVAVRADVARYDDVEAVGAAAMDAYGAVHIAVNNAGVALGGAMWELSLEDWEWVLGVDLWGVIHGVKAFTPLIIESGGGHIVNTASMAGLTSTPFMGPYNVAKHGVVTLSETLHHELALLHPGIGVTVLCPGWVRTGIHLSHRNRAATGVGGEPVETIPGDDEGRLDGTAGEGLAGMIGELIETGLDPDEVAAQVITAIRANTFYVLTHAAWSTAVTRRTELMVAGHQPEMTVPGND